MSAAFKPLALEAAGHFVRTRITAEDRAGIMVAEVAFQYLPPGVAGIYAEHFAASFELADALEAVRASAQCGCTLREAESGHRGDCWLPHWLQVAADALRRAGRTP